MKEEFQKKEYHLTSVDSSNTQEKLIQDTSKDKSRDQKKLRFKLDIFRSIYSQ